MVDTIEDLREVYTKWYKISDEDKELIDITIAAASDRRIPGDPIWLYIVGPSGCVHAQRHFQYTTCGRANIIDIINF